MLHYQLEFHTRIRSEMCPKCLKPMVLAEHSGYLRCFGKGCTKFSNRRIYISDGDVAMLPFGADTPYHGLFSQKQPDFETRYVRDPQTGRSVVVVEQGDAVKKLSYGFANATNGMSGSPIGVSAGAGNGMMNVESSSELTAKNGGVMLCNDPNFHAIEVVFSYINRPRRSGSKIGASMNRREMVMSNGIVDVGTWTPSVALVKYIKDQLCHIVCGGKCEAQRKCSGGTTNTTTHSSQPQSPSSPSSTQSSYSASSTSSMPSSASESTIPYGHDESGYFSEKSNCAHTTVNADCPNHEFLPKDGGHGQGCEWVRIPLNIAELKLVLSKIAQDSGCSDWAGFAKNPWFLTKIYGTIYKYTPVKLTDAQLRIATARFQEAQSLTKLMSLVQQPLSKVATVSRKSIAVKKGLDETTKSCKKRKLSPSDEHVAVKSQTAGECQTQSKQMFADGDSVMEAPPSKKRILCLLKNESDCKNIRTEQTISEMENANVAKHLEMVDNQSYLAAVASERQLANSTVSKIASVFTPSQTRQFKPGYVWFRIFKSMFGDRPTDATFLPHFFMLPTDQSKLAILDKWWEMVCLQKQWSNTLSSGTNHQSPPSYSIRIPSKSSVSLA